MMLKGKFYDHTQYNRVRLYQSFKNPSFFQTKTRQQERPPVVISKNKALKTAGIFYECWQQVKFEINIFL